MSFTRIGIEAKYTDSYGEERVLRGTRHGFQMKREATTPVLKVTSIMAKLVGQRIREHRLRIGMSPCELAMKAGLVSCSTTHAKHRIYDIEKAKRNIGIRLGTLYLIALALGVTPADLLPSTEEVMREAGLSLSTVQTIR